MVFLSAAHCGYADDMLTTRPTDSDTGTESRTESAKEDNSGESATGADSTACSHGEIQPSEVLLIGDSWTSLPAPRVGALARDADIIESDEDYVYRARAGATIEEIVQQYDLYIASSDLDVKVVIMNGGGIDTWRGSVSEESVSHVVETFSLYLNRLADDSSVVHLIYALYPDIPGYLDAKALRSPMRAACVESVVPCYFLDLHPLFEGHPEYTRLDTVDPTSAGSDVIAGAIWQIMQGNCIAQ